MKLRKLNDLKEKLDSPESFYFWLESKDPLFVVGRPLHSKFCMMVVYFNEDRREVSSVRGTTIIGSDDTIYSTPEWVTEIVCYFDSNFVHFINGIVKRSDLNFHMKQIAKICGVENGN